MTPVQRLRKALWRMGYDLSRYTPASHPLARRRKLLASLGIDLVLDVGANEGQFGRQLRVYVDYAGDIVSFEPGSDAFARLAEVARADGRWLAHRCALGEAEATLELKVSGNSVSSSLLEMLPAHRGAAPDSATVATEQVAVRTLDSMFEEFVRDHRHVYLKIDTQGFEDRVLRGAEASLPRIDAIQVELSFVPLYRGSLLFDELYALLRGFGFRLVSIEGEYADPRTGRLLQVDGIFARGEIADALLEPATPSC